MAKQFTVPASAKIYTVKLENFRGVDFANNATQVENFRSPDAQNIISDLAGKPVKRTGYETIANFNAQINGIFRLATENTEKFLVHAGTRLYEWARTNGEFASSGVQIYADMNNQRSVAFQNDKKLYLLDGKTYLCYGEFDGTWKVKKVTDIATVPKVVISRNPDGTGGTEKRQLNVLTQKRTYGFFGTADAKEYHLAGSDVKLRADQVTAKVMKADGTWADKVETTDFTVDRTKGIITFKTAPGVSPSGSADNVEITFVADTDYKYTTEIINKCTIAVQYGYRGSTDRVFVSGNPEVKNFHYWSAVNDPCYFEAYNYASLGQDSSAIMGYSLVGDALVVHKEDNEQDQTIFLVTGSYNADTGYSFAISGSVAGVGAISKYAFARIGTEPLFLSRQGVFSLTTQYMTAEKYAQNRSYYIDPRLTKEADLSEAVAKEYNGNYYLCVNGHVYMADGRQETYAKNAPQNKYQYEWYYLTNIDARIWWEYDGRLYFGSADGKVKRFKLAEEDKASHPTYSDDGEPIRAYWDTPILTMNSLSHYKTIKGFWVMEAPYRRSSIDVYYHLKGDLQLKKHSTMDIFDFNDIDFERFTFITDDSPMIIATNAKAKKFMLIQFRVENAAINEGFGFYEMEVSYVMGGKYKG